MDIVGIFSVIGIFFLPIVMVILIAWFNANYKSKRDKLKAELYIKAIENGQQIPENLFKEEVKKKKNFLQKGIICIAAGLGISLFFLLMGISDSDLSDIFPNMALGIIPLFIGIGYLFIHFLSEKQSTKKEDDSDK